VTAPVLRPLRAAWRRLTSMRTALVLLFMLAVAAVPGSLLPQRPLNPSATSAYVSSHGGWGRLLDALGFFDVFGSPWFAAIYLLLFVSLIGCLVPRIRVHARALRRAPLAAPRNLDRLPESGTFETADPPEQYAAAARAVLGRRWRVVRRTEPGGALTLSAEKGYSRETGNLLFHVALVGALVLVALGRLYAYQANDIVMQGHGFCNVVSQYDTWKPGRFAAEGKISPAPFCLNVDRFTATYSRDGEPVQFRADVSYERTARSHRQHRATITVNHPLRLQGDRVYLINHGFAPEVTIRMPDGSIRHALDPFVPTDASTLLSEGAFKEQGPTGKKQDVGISGFFAPTPVDDGTGIISSASPRVDHPVLGVIVYVGDLNYTGLPQSVYSLDTTKLHKIGMVNLRVGETKQFAGGVSVRFDGWRPWAGLQVSHDPAQGWLLIVAVLMVLGLLLSLGIRRRRIWLRLVPSEAGADGSPTLVAVGGLARSDSGNFPAEFAALLERLRSAGRPAHEALVGAGRE
jgi:cytochrome c biogenesis protein